MLSILIKCYRNSIQKALLQQNITLKKIYTHLKMEYIAIPN